MSPPGLVVDNDLQGFCAESKHNSRKDKSIVKEFIRSTLPNAKADRSDIKYAPYSGNYALKGRDAPVYLIVDDIKYDCTEWLSRHPGGDIILQYNGLDATDVFKAMHGKNAFKTLKALPHEKVPAFSKQESKEESSTTQRIKAFRELRQKFVDEGLFETSVPWYIYKTVTCVGLVVFAATMVFNLSPTSFFSYPLIPLILSSFIMGLGWQQLGWVAHEYLHHQVVEDREWNTSIGQFLGNVCSGFSIVWWKIRHNEHHAATNVIEHDPDIDNLPLLAWSQYDIDQVVERFGEKNKKTIYSILQYQKYYFFPLMCFLRVIWLVQSALLVKDLHKSTNRSFRKRQKSEILTMAAHYIWLSFVMLRVFQLGQSTYEGSFYGGCLYFGVYLLISQCFAGISLALVVFMNHYPIEKHGADTLKDGDWAALQCVGTLNVTKTNWPRLADWFFGGLNFQVEHHLFPTMPRHNLRTASKHVMQFCLKHNVPYKSVSPTGGVKMIFNWLEKISNLCVES
jgi:acyl-lipid Delta6-acetylenase / acyl-lipid (9-3)-desaturase